MSAKQSSHSVPVMDMAHGNLHPFTRQLAPVQVSQRDTHSVVHKYPVDSMV